MRVGLCQIPVSEDPSANLGRVREAVGRAAADGADLAVFPEATQVSFAADLRAAATPLDGPFVRGLAESAATSCVAVVAGVFEPTADGRVHNTAVVVDATGRLTAAYRKLHLFDALGYRESDQVAPGDKPTVVDIDDLRCGLMTCYDIRFPELARELVDQGAQALIVIAAWGAGLFKEEHWTTLMRARAIENTVWVVAVDQVPDPAGDAGRAPTGVGRSMLVDPFGVVRADLGPDPAVHVAEIDPVAVTRARDALPCLANRRRDLFG